MRYSLGSIFPRARCLSRFFLGPPSAIRACSADSSAMQSFISSRVDLYSGDEVSTDVGRTERADDWMGSGWFAIARRKARGEPWLQLGP